MHISFCYILQQLQLAVLFRASPSAVALIACTAVSGWLMSVDVLFDVVRITVSSYATRRRPSMSDSGMQPYLARLTRDDSATDRSPIQLISYLISLVDIYQRSCERRVRNDRQNTACVSGISHSHCEIAVFF